MAKRTVAEPPEEEQRGRRARAKAAFDAVLDSVHEGNRVLEGYELVKAVYEIFGVVRPLSTYKETK
ncbi:MAG: hypothetical protein KIS66_06125 [Fimbriimonadaceae bacterium]|nr:hypothetical protein [Fimbriimonadaceae bacterium]